MGKQKNVSISISLPEDLHNILVAEAERRMIHTSVIVRRALEEFLPQLPEIDSVLEPEGNVSDAR